MAIVLKPKSKEAAAVVPDGQYRATLSKVSTFDNAYGQRVGFEFTLDGPGVQGQKVMRSTTPNLSPSGKLADVLRGLLGRELTTDELAKGMDAEALVGVMCNVLVLQSKGKNGAVYSNVERIFPI
jgi:hypothetical protein